MHWYRWEFLKLVESFLSDRYQRVIHNGQTSSWADVKSQDPDAARIMRNNSTQENSLSAILFITFSYCPHIIKVNS